MVSTNKYSVLVVEDNKRIADMYQKWLSQKYETDVVYSAEDAAAQFDTEYDLVLLDRDLPEKNGDEILPKLREMQSDCIYAMLTATDPSEALISLKCDDYIRKPVPEEKLLATAEMLLNRRDYSAHLREYLSLGKKRELLSSKFSDDYLDDHEEYNDMVERLNELHNMLEREIDNLSHRETPELDFKDN